MMTCILVQATFLFFHDFLMRGEYAPSMLLFTQFLNEDAQFHAQLPREVCGIIHVFQYNFLTPWHPREVKLVRLMLPATAGVILLRYIHVMPCPNVSVIIQGYVSCSEKKMALRETCFIQSPGKGFNSTKKKKETRLCPCVKRSCGCHRWWSTLHVPSCHNFYMNNEQCCQNSYEYVHTY